MDVCCKLQPLFHLGNLTGVQSLPFCLQAPVQTHTDEPKPRMRKRGKGHRPWENERESEKSGGSAYGVLRGREKRVRRGERQSGIK